MNARAVLAAALFIGGCAQDVDATFGLRLIVGGQSVGDTKTATMTANTVAVLQIQLVTDEDMNASEESICVDLTTAAGKLTCPGAACTALALPDGGKLDSRRVFLDMPVGAFSGTTYAVYDSPIQPGTDVIAGYAYKASCAVITSSGSPATGASYLEISVVAADMAIPLDMTAID